MSTTKRMRALFKIGYTFAGIVDYANVECISMDKAIDRIFNHEQIMELKQEKLFSEMNDALTEPDAFRHHCLSCNGRAGENHFLNGAYYCERCYNLAANR